MAKNEWETRAKRIKELSRDFSCCSLQKQDLGVLSPAKLLPDRTKVNGVLRKVMKNLETRKHSICNVHSIMLVCIWKKRQNVLLKREQKKPIEITS